MSQPIEYKVTLLGAHNAGKSSLVARSSTGEFYDGFPSTNCASYASMTVSLGNTEVWLELWDTAGYPHLHSHASIYYQGANAIVLAFAVDDEDSLNEVKTWADEVKESANPIPVFFVVGTKIDIPNRTVTTEQGEAMAKQIGAIYTEVSAKSGFGCRELFVRIANLALEKFNPGVAGEPLIRHIAAYLLAVSGGDSNPNKNKITAILNAAGVAAFPKAIDALLAKMAGKNLEDVIATGTSKLSLVSGGVGDVPTASGIDEESSKQEAEPEPAKKEEEAALDLAGGFDDLFG
jgi:small GTP-binding protein